MNAKMEVLESDSDASIKKSEREVAKMKQDYDQISQRLDNKRMNLRKVFFELMSLNCGEESAKWEVSLKIDELNKLHLSLDKLSFSNNAYKDKGKPFLSSCLSVGEVDKQFLMVHGSKNRKNEKKLIREISSSLKKDNATTLDELDTSIRKLNEKIDNSHSCRCSIDLEAIHKEIKLHEQAREKAVANAAVNGRLWNSLGSKKDIEKQVKVIYKELDELRTIQVGARKVKAVKKKMEYIEKQISSLQKQLDELYLDE